RRRSPIRSAHGADWHSQRAAGSNSVTKHYPVHPVRARHPVAPSNAWGAEARREVMRGCDARLWQRRNPSSLMRRMSHLTTAALIELVLLLLVLLPARMAGAQDSRPASAKPRDDRAAESLGWQLGTQAWTW